MNDIREKKVGCDLLFLFTKFDNIISSNRIIAKQHPKCKSQDRIGEDFGIYADFVKNNKKLLKKIELYGIIINGTIDFYKKCV